VQADLKLLKQVLYWACTVIGAESRPWLDRNPLADVEIAGESDVRRPVASQERFLATRRAMQEMRLKYELEAEQELRPNARRRAKARARSWLRADLALVLLEGTGRRRGSVASLRWNDVDFEQHRITWRAESDKKRKSWRVVYSASFLEEVQSFKDRLSAEGGCVFPQADDPNAPIKPELISQWVLKAEAAAGLPNLEGGLCHPYRRKWRSERSHHPVKSVAQAGGWSDLVTMLNCHDIPDDDAILAVTSEPRRRWEKPENRTNAVAAAEPS